MLIIPPLDSLSCEISFWKSWKMH